MRFSDLSRITSLLCLHGMVLAGRRARPEAVCQSPCPLCPAESPCQQDVPLILDGCRCCHLCSRQHGQTCNSIQPCDVTKNITCDVTGVCVGRDSASCHVGGTEYRDGETFLADCRTRCVCQDGSYACTSLCPHEMIRPSRRCRSPRLVDVAGQCCRQWMCDDDAPTTPTAASCEPLTSDWSPCSATCAGGVSTRISNHNPDCTLVTETRLCQIRECAPHGDTSWSDTLYQMLRRDETETCHPTQRVPEAVHLHVSNCTSVRRYRPRFCTSCRRHCCRPVVSATRPLVFSCDLERGGGVSDLNLWRLGDDSRPPAALRNTVTRQVMWVKKCVCVPCEVQKADEDRSVTNTNEDERSSENNPRHFMGGDIEEDEAL